MNRDPPTLPHTGSAQALPDHGRLIRQIEHVHDVLRTTRDSLAIRTALDQLNELAGREFPMEEKLLFRHHRAELPVHHSEHAMLVEKLRQFRRRLDTGALSDSDRGELYDLVTDWLLHALVDP